jgi:hypothetical protein
VAKIGTEEQAYACVSRYAYGKFGVGSRSIVTMTLSGWGGMIGSAAQKMKETA